MSEILIDFITNIPETVRKYDNFIEISGSTAHLTSTSKSMVFLFANPFQVPNGKVERIPTIDKIITKNSVEITPPYGYKTKYSIVQSYNKLFDIDFIVEDHWDVYTYADEDILDEGNDYLYVNETDNGFKYFENRKSVNSSDPGKSRINIYKVVKLRPKNYNTFREMFNAEFDRNYLDMDSYNSNQYKSPDRYHKIGGLYYEKTPDLLNEISAFVNTIKNKWGRIEDNTIFLSSYNDLTNRLIDPTLFPEISIINIGLNYWERSRTQYLFDYGPAYSNFFGIYEDNEYVYILGINSGSIAGFIYKNALLTTKEMDNLRKFRIPNNFNRVIIKGYDSSKEYDIFVNGYHYNLKDLKIVKDLSLDDKLFYLGNGAFFDENNEHLLVGPGAFIYGYWGGAIDGKQEILKGDRYYTLSQRGNSLSTLTGDILAGIQGRLFDKYGQSNEDDFSSIYYVYRCLHLEGGHKAGQILWTNDKYTNEELSTLAGDSKLVLKTTYTADPQVLYTKLFDGKCANISVDYGTIGSAGTVTYRISNNGDNWYYWNGSNWIEVNEQNMHNYDKTCSIDDINNNIDKFYSQVSSTPKIALQIMLYSHDSASAVEVDNVKITTYSNNFGNPDTLTYKFKVPIYHTVMRRILQYRVVFSALVSRLIKFFVPIEKWKYIDRLSIKKQDYDDDTQKYDEDFDNEIRGS